MSCHQGAWYKSQPYANHRLLPYDIPFWYLVSPYGHPEKYVHTSHRCVDFFSHVLHVMLKNDKT